MKKLNYLYIALIAIILVSCSKEAMNNIETSYENTVLYASLSQPENENGTKTSLDGLDVVWSDDDAIAVFANNATEFKKYVSDNTGTGTSLAQFSGEAVDAAYAYYPYKGVTSIDGSNNISVVIPRVQTYSANSFGQFDMPMLATASGSGLSFHNLMAVLKLQLTGTGIVDRIIVMSDTQKMSGMATVATNGTITFSTTDGESYNWVELDCGTTGVDLSTNPSFYISVPAGSYSFTVRVVSKSSTVAPDKTVSSAKTFTANKIKPMTSYSVAFGSDFKYVDGAYVGDPIAITISSTEYKWAPVNCGYNGSYTLGKYGKLFQSGRKYGQRGGVTITPTTSARTGYDGSDIFNEFKFFSAEYNSGEGWVYPTNPLWWEGSAKTQYDPCPTGWRVPSLDELTTLMGYEDPSSCHHNNRVDATRHDTDSDGLFGFWFDGGATMNPTTGVFLHACGFRKRENGENGLIGSNDANICYVTRNNSNLWNYPMLQSSVKYDYDIQKYYEAMDITYQASAQSFPIRCIKE